MIIRQDFQETPPKMFLMQILDPVAKIYFFLWDKKDKMNRISFTWIELSKYYNKNSFRTALRKLCNEGLLNYIESIDDIAIELVGWDDIQDN
jgi:hypothetical protein